MIDKKYIFAAIIFFSIDSYADAAKFSANIEIPQPVGSKNLGGIVNQHTIIDPESGNNMTYRAEIHLAQPNSKGVSHTKFEEFGFSNIEGEVFIKDPSNGKMVSQIVNFEGHVQAKLFDGTKLAVIEVTGDKGSIIRGNFENIGVEKADLVFANKNGYIVGAEFTKFNDVTLIKDKVSLNRSGGFEYENYEYFTDSNYHAKRENFGAFPFKIYSHNISDEITGRYIFAGHYTIDSEGNVKSRY